MSRPTRRPSPAVREEETDQVVTWLVIVNLVVFAAWQLPATEPLMAEHFVVSYAGVMSGRVWTLLTYAFSHYDLWHLLFNGIGLWVFGREVGHRYGGPQLLQLYLVGGVVAGLGHLLYQVLALDPSPALGASGSVMALAAVYGLTFPNRTIVVQFLLPLPAWVAVATYILLDVAGALGIGSGSVAHAAHLGGALWGALFWAWSNRVWRR